MTVLSKLCMLSSVAVASAMASSKKQGVVTVAKGIEEVPGDGFNVPTEYETDDYHIPQACRAAMTADPLCSVDPLVSNCLAGDFESCDEIDDSPPPQVMTACAAPAIQHACSEDDEDDVEDGPHYVWDSDSDDFSSAPGVNVTDPYYQMDGAEGPYDSMNADMDGDGVNDPYDMNDFDGPTAPNTTYGAYHGYDPLYQIHGYPAPGNMDGDAYLDYMDPNPYEADNYTSTYYESGVDYGPGYNYTYMDPHYHYVYGQGHGDSDHDGLNDMYDYDDSPSDGVMDSTPYNPSSMPYYPPGAMDYSSDVYGNPDGDQYPNYMDPHDNYYDSTPPYSYDPYMYSTPMPTMYDTDNDGIPPTVDDTDADGMVDAVDNDDNNDGIVDQYPNAPATTGAPTAVTPAEVPMTTAPVMPPTMLANKDKKGRAMRAFGRHGARKAKMMLMSQKIMLNKVPSAEGEVDASVAAAPVAAPAMAPMMTTPAAGPAAAGDSDLDGIPETMDDSDMDGQVDAVDVDDNGDGIAADVGAPAAATSDPAMTGPMSTYSQDYPHGMYGPYGGYPGMYGGYPGAYGGYPYGGYPGPYGGYPYGGYGHGYPGYGYGYGYHGDMDYDNVHDSVDPVHGPSPTGDYDADGLHDHYDPNDMATRPDDAPHVPEDCENAVMASPTCAVNPIVQGCLAGNMQLCWEIENNTPASVLTDCEGDAIAQACDAPTGPMEDLDGDAEPEGTFGNDGVTVAPGVLSTEDTNGVPADDAYEPPVTTAPMTFLQKRK